MKLRVKILKILHYSSRQFVEVIYPTSGGVEEINWTFKPSEPLAYIYVRISSVPSAGLRWTGLPKTLVLERVIAQHNPRCKVSCFESTWNKEKIVSYLEDCDLVLDTTANQNFSLYLNEICVEQEKPTIFAATYRRATIGRIVIYRGPQDPCLACYVDAPMNWSSDAYPIIPPLNDEQFIEDGCGVVTEEAVALDVEVIANLTTRVAVKLVREQHDSSNLVIHVNEAVVGSTNVLSQEGIHWLTNHPLEAVQYVETDSQALSALSGAYGIYD